MAAVVAALVGCSGGGGSPTTPPPAPPPPPPSAPVLTSIGVSGGTTVAVGASLSLVASPKDQSGNAIAATVNWSSGSANVATVNPSGVVTGVAAGSTVITAASGSVSGTTTIAVTAVPVLTSIVVGGGTSVVAGATLQLSASPKDQNGNAIAATVAWSSGATGVATVTSSGLVAGVAPGTAVITASSGGVNGTAIITVTPTPPVLTTITISGGTTVVARSDLQLTGLPKDQNGNAIAAALTWSSSATGIATVSGSGRVTGVTVGTAVITVASGGVSATSTITVTPQILTAITISGAATVSVGQTVQLAAASVDQNGVGMVAVYTWASDATSIATVSGSGLVTGVLVGVAQITASSNGINSLQKTITVAVFPVSANVSATAGAAFVPPTVDIARGGSVNWIFAGLGHTVTFDTPTVDTPAGIPVTSGATVSRTFLTAGTFAYHCEIHGSMAGTVIVH